MMTMMDSVFQFGALMMFLVWFLIPIVIIIFIIRLIRKFENRAEERLAIEKEQVELQKQQMDTINELNQRIIKIETMLKDVE